MQTRFINNAFSGIAEAYYEFLKYASGDEFNQQKVDYIYRADVSFLDFMSDCSDAILEVLESPTKLKGYLSQVYFEGIALQLLRFIKLRDHVLGQMYMGDMGAAAEDDTFLKIQNGYIELLNQLEQHLRTVVWRVAGFYFTALANIKLADYDISGRYNQEIALYQNEEMPKFIEGSTSSKVSHIDLDDQYTGIVFNLPDIDSLIKGLAPYFPEQELSLGLLLKGEEIEEKLIFTGNARQLVEVFRRLMYNGFIKSTSKNVGQWLYQNFRVTFKQGPSITVQELKEATVYEYLTKSKGDLRDRSKRILDEKWLPYKNHDALQIEKEKEKR